MDLNEQQREELRRVARQGQPAHLRSKALAMLGLDEGRSVGEVAGSLRVSRQAVYNWRRRYLEQGVGAWRVRAGRGRKPRADLQQLQDYVRQSPRHFGVPQTRWTLASLARTVPSLAGFSPYGVQKALARAGISYKRGQPSLHSPDPEYAQKKGRWSKL